MRDDLFLYTANSTTHMVIPFVEHRLADQSIVGM
jgi:hypothetical protein